MTETPVHGGRGDGVHDVQVSSQRDDELRALRRRAYGPDADIHTDAAAVRRLQQLEGHRSEAGPAGTEEPPSATLLQSREGTAAEGLARASGFGSNQQRALWRRFAAQWIASVLAAVVVTIVVANAFIQGMHDSFGGDDATQVGSLREDDSWKPPSFFTAGGDPEGVRAFGDFLGMRAVITTAGESKTGSCLWVMNSADADAAAGRTDGSFEGPLYNGCAAGSFPAEVAFEVTRDSPDRLRQAFPVGTALQFVSDEAGGDVVVFKSAPTTAE